MARRLKITEDSWRDPAFRRKHPYRVDITSLAYQHLRMADVDLYHKVRTPFLTSKYSPAQHYAVCVAIFATRYNWKDKHE